MPELSFRFENATLPEDVLQVHGFVGEEAISRPFYFELNLFSRDRVLDFGEVVGQPAALVFQRGDAPVRIHGLVVDFEQGGATADLVSYRAVLRPRVWTLSLTSQSRIFQHLSVPEVIQKVLEEAGFSAGRDFRLALEGTYDVREFIVQYNEDDWAFICRLMEHVGIFFFFEHGDDHETLVITDDRSHCPKIEGEATLAYHPETGALTSGEAAEIIDGFVCREQLVTGKVKLKDYNYRTPDTDLLAESQINGDMEGTYYEYGDHQKDPSESDRLAQVRNEEIECRRRVMTGSGNSMGFRAGHVFTLDGHYRADLDDDYLLTQVTHQGSQGAGLADVLGGETYYGNTFTCIPSGVAYRPPRETPVPRIPGIMTATMEGGGPYAHIDDQGRYRARAHFDLGDAADADATLPIRMAQPYSGPDYGMHFPNHAGTEMVWACIDGNVDRPMALGTVPNPNNVSPSTSANKPQSVIRTWGKNELTFDDTQGEENIYMFATKDHTVEVTNDESITVGHDQTIGIGNDRTKTVGHDQSETVGHDKSIEVVNNHTETIGVDKSLTVGSNHTENIGTNMTITVGANLTEAVALNYSETVGVSMQLSVGVHLMTSVGGNSTETVGVNKSETVGAKKSVSVGTDLSETVGKDKSVTVGKDLNEKVGGNHHEQVSKEFALNAKKIQLLAEDQIVLKCGKAEIIMKKSGDIEIQGKKIQIKGSGDLILKGKKIKEN